MISNILRKLWDGAKNVNIVASIMGWSGLGKIIAGFAGSGFLGVWGVVDQLPGSIIALMVLAGFTGAIWAVNGVQWWRTRPEGIHVSTVTEISPPPIIPASGAYLSRLSLRMTDLVPDDHVIRDRIFEDCHLYGPAMMVHLGGNSFTHCEFYGRETAIFLEVPEDTEVIGAIGVENCIFRRCHFHSIGFILPPQNLATFRADILRHSHMN
jgi:hypothetical protein